MRSNVNAAMRYLHLAATPLLKRTALTGMTTRMTTIKEEGTSRFVFGRHLLQVRAGEAIEV